MTLVTFIELLFGGSLLAVAWAYVGYFITMYILSIIRPKPVKRQDWFPPISLIITAFNEEKRITRKIENCLALDYPKDKLEIIIVSDGSTDATDHIVRTYAEAGIKLLPMPKRRGKHYGQGRGIIAATSDIVVLSDATTFLEPEALTKIVRSYADPSVGCVSGEDKTETAGGEPAGEGAYVQYEMKLRAFEEKVDSIVGASGSFYSVRKSLCKDWIDDMSSDFYMPIIAKMNGYRAVVDHEAFGVYRVVSDTTREFERKVRTVVHGLEVLFKFRAIMNPFKYGGYAFQMISHKLCRWLVPFALIIALVTNLALWQAGWFYQVTLALQALLYVLALAGYFFRWLQRFSLFKFPLFFVMVNLSILVAWFKYLSGDQYVVWEATKR